MIFSYCSANPGAFHRTDAAGYVFWSERVIELDARLLAFPWDLITANGVIGVDNTLRAGDTVDSITGVIDFGPATSDSAGLGAWRIVPLQNAALAYASSHPRPARRSERSPGPPHSTNGISARRSLG